jgi:hypothetical protein
MKRQKYRLGWDSPTSKASKVTVTFLAGFFKIKVSVKD